MVHSSNLILHGRESKEEDFPPKVLFIEMAFFVKDHLIRTPDPRGTMPSALLARISTSCFFA
jgi:hypothetical protein